MAIIINDEAKKLLKEKNKNYILISLFQQSCWGGGVNKVIVVSIASKFDKELYSKYVVDGIDVYIDNRLTTDNEVEICTEKFFFMRQLSQKGIDI